MHAPLNLPGHLSLSTSYTERGARDCATYSARE